MAVNKGMEEGNIGVGSLESVINDGSVESQVAQEVAPVVETPSETVVEETKEGEVVTPSAEQPAEVLYDLPDGRKVDAETLTREWKENFLPEFTRKSQELSNLTKSNQAEPVKQERGDDWTPSSYAEIVEVAKQEAINQIVAQQQQAMERQKEVEAAISTQLTEIKKTEPSLDEARLFQHANKYQFSDLRLAYQNMKDMNLVAKTVEKTVQKNIAVRSAEPVAGKQTGTVDNSGIDWNQTQALKGVSALEYLQGLGK